MIGNELGIGGGIGMPNALVSRVFGNVHKDKDYHELKSKLKHDLENANNTNGDTYQKVISQAGLILQHVQAVGEHQPLESPLDACCELVLNDVATVGKCRFPWELVRGLLIVTWTGVLDEVFELENPAANPQQVMMHEEEKRQSLHYLSLFQSPPATLQRLAELPFKQPYFKTKSLYRALRKLISVRDFQYDPVCIPIFCNKQQPSTQLIQPCEPYKEGYSAIGEPPQEGCLVSIASPPTH
ncbi:hypothetical protein BdWA1_003195 [Babesia duncani]|uniref:Uncharacterized protein n=1 Tax=Babesia duncani TaxID=323732 RepID=A0AAD9UN41_9APIC|nr:hypothetical protein BdWA1_003195 [Babesia duncani]